MAGVSTQESDFWRGFEVVVIQVHFFTRNPMGYHFLKQQNGDSLTSSANHAHDEQHILNIYTTIKAATTREMYSEHHNLSQQDHSNHATLWHLSFCVYRQHFDIVLPTALPVV